MLGNYKIINTGAIKQIKVTPIVYDKKYIQDRYDSYGVKCDFMSYLRYGFIIGKIGRKPDNVLDVGYGNGSFLKICQEGGIQTFGTDISNYELKYGKFLDFDDCLKMRWDLVTFFDSLEHFEDISFLNKLNTNYICISVPNCYYNVIKKMKGEKCADEYFKNWKHRRENEHIWHFDIKSLDKTMELYDYELVDFNHIEDIIRKPTTNYPNILTAIFKKR